MTRQRVAVFGAAGMAGHVMVEYLRGLEGFDVNATARSSTSFRVTQLDVSDFVAVTEWLRESRPTVVVNCVGLLVNQSAGDIAAAIQINSYFPHALAKLGVQEKFRVVHISTDCVFSGDVGDYKEDSVRDGDTTYARTKALGEIKNNRDLTIRTSIVGPELKTNGTGLLDWFLKQSGPIEGYDEVYWSGVSTLQLAKAVSIAIKQNTTGLIHLCQREKISKYEMLTLFAEVWQRPTEIMRNSTLKSDKSLQSTRRDWLYTPPGYREMFIELRDWMDDRADRYAHCYQRK